MPSVHASVTIDAPIDRVWDKIKDFHDFSWAPGIVTACEDVGETAGNAPGAKRLVNDAFLDRLLEYDAAGHGYKYTIENGPSPISPAEISNFVGHLRLESEDGGRTRADYSGDWEAEGSEAVDLMQGVYGGLLNELAEQFGA